MIITHSAENREFFERTMPDELLEDLTTMIATSSVLEGNQSDPTLLINHSFSSSSASHRSDIILTLPVGEMIESASTADVLFWMIHPAIERLLAAKRLPEVRTQAQKATSP